MNPVAFNIGNFEIRWYGILIVLRIVLVKFNKNSNNILSSQLKYN